MKTAFTLLTLLIATSSLATSNQGIICREDRRLEKGPLKEMILTPQEGGYLLQQQYVASLNSPVEVENWTSNLSCRIDEKTAIAFCQNTESKSVVTFQERRQAFFDSLEENTKKKTSKHTDIILSHNGVPVKNMSFSAGDCESYGPEA